MEKIKLALRMLTRGQLAVEGRGRTFVRCPLWLAVLAAVWGRGAFRFAILTALLIVAFGMRVRVEAS